MVCKDTLIFKNLPPELTDIEKRELLTHFGAKNIKIITSQYKQKSRAFAKFDSEDIAKNVMHRLHQISILGSRLSVEYAEEEIGCDKIQLNFLEDEDVNKHFKVFLNKLNSWNNAVNFSQPPPPHLKYLYPRANRATINNIAHALATVPKFYTQVLHLMNRMNLPPPFSNIPDPPIHQPPPPLPPQAKPPEIPQPQPKEESTSESEYESDPEEINQKNQEIIPEKRKRPQKKMVKKPKFIKPQQVVPSGKPAQNPDEVFEKVNLQKEKKIELKVSENLEPREEKMEVVESFGIIPSQKTNTKDTTDEEADKIEEETKIITEEELSSNRISPKDFGVLPVFKNYHAGAPSCRLYIKNLAKNVEMKDLEYIYKRYDVPETDEDQGNMFDVRLMQEGRMKGQAFITLQNVTLAQKAVKETNGFILKNKPLVVVFARSAIPKPK